MDSRHRWLRVGALAVVLCALPFVLAPLYRGTSADGTIEVGATFHGFWGYDSDSEAEGALRTFEQAGGSWVRIDVGWQTLEPAKGRYSAWAMDDYDEAIELAHAQGLNIMLVLLGTPSWANGSSDETLAPRDADDFGDFALWLTQRYEGKVQAVELWNEPNHDTFFRAQRRGQEAEEHAAMVKDAYRKIKEFGPRGDDAVTVLAGSPAHVDVDWWERMYAAGVRDYTDVVAVNPYPMPADLPPDAEGDGTRYRMAQLRELVRLMDAHGDSQKPIWFSEFGWSNHPDPPGADPWEQGVTSGQQADYFEQTIRLLQTTYPQVEKVFWYNLVDRDDTDSVHSNNFGLLEEDGTPKPVLERMEELFGR